MGHDRDQKKRVNLGCGTQIYTSGINADIRPLQGVNLVCDATHLPFKDNSLELILASDIIEHFSRHEYLGVLNEWNRSLQPGGELHIKTPNLQTLAFQYMQHFLNGEELSRRIFGNQGNPYDFHKNLFTPLTLKRSLIKAGFIKISIIEVLRSPDETNMQASARTRTE